MATTTNRPETPMGAANRAACLGFAPAFSAEGAGSSGRLRASDARGVELGSALMSNDRSTDGSSAVVGGAPTDDVDTEWAELPGGELEVPRPRVRCLTCRGRAEQMDSTTGTERARRESPICFACYTADRDRERALMAAKKLETASSARFAEVGPFEPVNRARLVRLRAERLEARRRRPATEARGADRRRQAQLSAQRALQLIAEGLRRRRPPSTVRPMAAAASTSPLPESWLPFVASH